MVSLNEIFNLAKKLSDSDRAKLKELLSNTICRPNTFNSFITENRFASGIFCPHCKSEHVKKNGHKNTTQRYLCMDCRRTFTVTTNTILASTKKDFSVWEKYIDCMFNGYSVRKSAEVCGINKDTAFVWRHKILDALQNMAESVKLDGIIESDETFFSISYKGNHKISKFVMPRQSHHRGKQTHIRGLSHEKICVPCAVNRNGLSIAKISNLGRVSTRDIHKVFDNRIEKHSILCTDDMNSYVRFAKSNGIELIQLKSGKSKKGVYHIQHINAYHSMLKSFIAKFKGVSTKYLNNYLIWNNILNYAKEPFGEKKAIFKKFVFSTDKTVLFTTVRKRSAIPVLN